MTVRPLPLPRRPLRVLGLMSGTSLDGVDCAVCDCTPRSVRLARHWRVNFPPRLRARLEAAARDAARTWELGQLHHDLGRFYARAALAGPGRLRVAAVGLHGQTVFHQPRPPAATWQIGEPAWLAEALRVPVVSNFRAADLAAGGQGAPLATLFHQVAFGRPGEWVCVNNLGGISNVTSLDWRRRDRAPRVRAFDTGPANVLLDLAARHFSGGRRACDRDGRLAARGRVCEPLLARWLAHPFFHRPPPKSTGREEFGEPFWREVLAAARRRRLTPEDVLATLTEFTARSLVLNYRLHLGGRPDRVVLTGGGAANPELVRRITAGLRAWHPAIAVTDSAALGWPWAAVEAAAFALLAAYRLWDLPANLPATTGARRAVRLGQVTRP